MSLQNLKTGNPEQQQQSHQRKCPNQPIADLDHKVMSKADRRRASKNEQPITKEEREQARENLQELRKRMRHLKSHGWRGKVRRQDRNVVKRDRAGEGDNGMYMVNEDAAYDDEEARVLQSRMGVSRTRKGAGGEGNNNNNNNNSADASSSSATGLKRNATGLKRHKADSW